MTAVWLVVLIGPAMGSFAALLADRLPRGEAVLAARSRCRSCGTALGARDLVPLVSYPWLRGRCRHCGAAIPGWVWGAEWAGLALGAAAAWLAGPWAGHWGGAGPAVVAALWLWCLLALALADLRSFRLPDPLTAALLVLGTAMAWPHWEGAALGAAAGAGVFLALRLGYRGLTGRDGMGLGDVKLMAGIGAGLGAAALPMVALIAAGSALLVAMLHALRRGRRLRRQGAVPFGAWLAAAAVAVWVVQRLP